MPPAWLAMSAVAGIEAVWARWVGLSVEGCWPIACVALGLMAAGALCRRSPSFAAVGDMTAAAGNWIAFTATGCVLTYLSARCGLPLRDEALESLDRCLHFDWMAWSAWVAAHPPVHLALRMAYASLLPQIVLCCCVLPLTAGARRLSDLFWSAFATLLVTSAASALVPALGAFAHHGLPARADWLADLLALRRPGPVAFTLHRMKGVVTMPSYHAVLAVLFIHAHRRTGCLGAAVALLNLIVIVSTPSEGGHYLCDVIAGGLVATASIVVVRGAMSARARSVALRSPWEPTMARNGQSGAGGPADRFAVRWKMPIRGGKRRRSGAAVEL